MFLRLTAWDETVEQLDSVRKENKNLGDEIKDLLDQLGEGGRSIHELDKQRRRLQVQGLFIFNRGQWHCIEFGVVNCNTVVTLWQLLLFIAQKKIKAFSFLQNVLV